MASSRLCLVSATGHADSQQMMRFHRTPPPRLDLEPSTGIACAVCGENQIAMIDGRCGSCLLGEMRAGRGGDVPYKSSPHGQISREGSTIDRKRTW
jgi:hypothetical protein